MIKLSRDHFFYPMAEINGYIMEHRLIMAKHLNRCLLPWETVHHINGIKDDNRLGNLELFPSQAKHNAMTRVSNYIIKLENENKELRRLLKGWGTSQGSKRELELAIELNKEVMYE